MMQVQISLTPLDDTVQRRLRRSSTRALALATVLGTWLVGAGLPSADAGAEAPLVSSIEGRVTGPTGEPIANAVVLLARPDWTRPYYRWETADRSLTDDSGRFCIDPSQASSSYWLRVEASTFVSHGEVDVKPGANLSLTLVPALAFFHGIVIDAETREPVGGVNVIVGDPRTKGHQDVTGADGRFRVPLRAGQYAVALRVGADVLDATWIDVAATDVEKTLVMRRGRRVIRARVVDSAERAVGRARAVVASDDDGVIVGATWAGADGSVEIGQLAAGRYSIFAYSLDAGFGLKRGVTPDGAPVTIALSPARRVLLRVTDDAGRPLAHERVLLVLTRWNEWGIGSIARDGIPSGWLYVDPQDTDPKGQIEAVLPDGFVELDVIGHDGGRRAVVVGAPAPRDPIVISLPDR